MGEKRDWYWAAQVCLDDGLELNTDTHLVRVLKPAQTGLPTLEPYGKSLCGSSPVKGHFWCHPAIFRKKTPRCPRCLFGSTS